jgi:hypothetical protein
MKSTLSAAALCLLLVGLAHAEPPPFDDDIFNSTPTYPIDSLTIFSPTSIYPPSPPQPSDPGITKQGEPAIIIRNAAPPTPPLMPAIRPSIPLPYTDNLLVPAPVMPIAPQPILVPSPPNANGNAPKTIQTITIKPVPKEPSSKLLPPIVNLGKVPTRLVGRKILPPPEYDHHYDGALKITVAETFAELADFCGRALKNACAKHIDGGDRCLVYMIKEELLQWTREIVLRHEIGHCNGWPGDHPGMLPLPP